jgi:rubredoxin
MNAYWVCIKCGYNRSSSSNGNTTPPKPLTLPCSKGGNHNYHRADGKVSITWECPKCGAITRQNCHPLITSCPRGGGHTWRKSANQIKG